MFTVYGRYGCARSHYALQLLREACELCETVDVGHCRHCHGEMVRRLQAAPPRGRGPVRPPPRVASIPQIWAPDGTFIGDCDALSRWIEARKQEREKYNKSIPLILCSADDSDDDSLLLLQ